MRAVTVVLLSAPAFAAPIMYADSNLLVSDYQILTGTSNGTVSLSNSAGALVADRTISASGGFANFAAIRSSFAYDTGMGQLTSIDVSARISTTIPPWALFLQQGGLLYRAPISVASGVNQFSSRTGLVAPDFVQIDLSTNTFGSATPNFNAAFVLGFGQRFFAPGSITNSIVFDDLSITLNVESEAVPEPAAITLSGAALLLLAAFRRNAR